MARDVARDWMWSEACEMLARAERMHRELFRPVGTQARQPEWEPPVDVLETEYEVLALVEAVRKSLGPDGKAMRATVTAVANLVRALADGVRGARRVPAGSVG